MVKKHPIYEDYGADMNGVCYSFKKGTIKILKQATFTGGYKKITTYGERY